MKKDRKENFIVDLSDSSASGNEESIELRPNGSHGMALNRPFGAEVSEEEIERQSQTTFGLTVREKVVLTDRQCGLLLDILNYQAVHFGVTFNSYLAMFHFYSKLCKNRKASEVTNVSYLVTVMVTELILETFRDFLFPLNPGEMAHLPERVKEILKEGLISKRTYGSRFTCWRPENFLSVLTVPVESRFLDSVRNSSPYISYCKGYGESHPSAHRHKTKFSSELDANASEEDRLEELNLLVRSVHPKHRTSESLRIDYDLFLRNK